MQGGFDMENYFTGSTTSTQEFDSTLTYDDILECSKLLQDAQDKNQELFKELSEGKGDLSRGDLLLIPEKRYSLYRELEKMLPESVMSNIKLSPHFEDITLLCGVVVDNYLVNIQQGKLIIEPERGIMVI